MFNLSAMKKKIGDIIQLVTNHYLLNALVGQQIMDCPSDKFDFYQKVKKTPTSVSLML